MSVDRLPEPAPVRAGAEWVIEREPDWRLVADGRLCNGYRNHCPKDAVAARRDGRYANCLTHLRQGLMWIENGQVVSWRLQPVLA